jgi:hypothetical protein
MSHIMSHAYLPRLHLPSLQTSPGCWEDAHLGTRSVDLRKQSGALGRLPDQRLSTVSRRRPLQKSLEIRWLERKLNLFQGFEP